MIIDELIALLGFETKGGDDLKRFKDGIDGAVKKAQEFGRRLALAGAAAGTAFAAVGTGMFKLAKDAAGPLDELVKVSDRIGVAFEDLQELGFAAEQSGASTTELASSLQSMGRQLAEAARDTGRAKLALEAYGLSATDASGEVKGTVDFLGEIAEKMATLSDAQALDLGTKLGLSPAMITMLKSGNEEIEKLRLQARDGGLIFTEKEARQAEAFNDQLNLFQRSITAIRHRVGVQFLPVLQQTISRMQDWVNANQQLIRQNIEVWTGRIVAGMEAAIESAGRFIRAIFAVGDRIGDLFRYLSGGGINLSTWQALAGLGALLLRIFAPFTFWLTAAYLALDELFAYMEGADSYLGDFIQWIQDTTGASEGLAQILAAVAVALGLLIIARPLWLLGWLARLIGLAGSASVITALAAAVRGLAVALSSLAGASTVASSSGLLGLLGRLGLAAGTGGALLSLSGSTADNDYLNADPEERARMRDEARRRAEEYNRERQELPGKSGRVPRTQRIRRDAEANANDLGFGPDPERFGGDAPSPANAEALLKALHNFKAWGDYTNSGAAQAVIEDHSVANDNRDQSVNVGSPNVTVNVQQAVEAPAAVGSAVGNAVGAAAVPPARRVTGN